MKITSVLTIFFIFFTVAAKEGKPSISSRVRFEKGLSESTISGWEKDFFKISDVLETPDEIADIEEIPDIDTVKTIKKVRHPKKRTVVRSQNKIESDISQDVAGTQQDVTATQQDVVSQPVEKIEKKPAVEQPAPEMEIEKTEEVPDNLANDVDRSERMRKMKELLKKRKGKGRIEDRRVY
jgi:hypothetical protein